MNILIRSGRLIDPAQGRDEVCDLYIADGRVAAIGHGLAQQAQQVIDAAGLVVCPGLVDMHVHLREPGFEYKEDIDSGTRAAAAGGVTSVVAMPNTKPVCDNPDAVRDVLARAEARAHVHVYPAAAITRGSGGGELCDYEELKAAGAVALTDDGRPVENAAMMMEAMRRAARCGLAIISHCEEISLSGGVMNEGETARRLGVRGITHSFESVQAARECALAMETGCPVHIAHVSTWETVALVRAAKAAGAPITCETAPHYICLTDEAVLDCGANAKMNPPLRGRRDVEALIEALGDGTIDAIATDHAPHAAHEKAALASAANGIVGLETSLAVCLGALYHTGRMPLPKIIEKMTAAPARIVNIPRGSAAVGMEADLALFDPDAYWTVGADMLQSKGKNTPFLGRTLRGQVKYTIVSGRIVKGGC